MSLNYRSIGTNDYMKLPKSIFTGYLSTKSLESSQSARSHFVLHCPPKCVESSFIVFYVKGVKRARTTRTGTGSSSQEQEVADLMMTLERRMEYLRGRPVAKERPVTLSDFDQLLYEEHFLYQLFEYQGFLHQLSWTEGFCVDAVVQDFFCALVSVDRAPEVQLEVLGVQFLFSVDVIADFLNCPQPESLFFRRTHSTRAQCMLLLGQQTWIDFSLYMFEMIMDEAWGIKEYSLPYGVFLTQFLISRGVVIAASDTRKESSGGYRRGFTAFDINVRGTSGDGSTCSAPPWVAQLFTDLDSRVSVTVKATLLLIERQMQSLDEQLKELRTAFDGECTVTMLRNKLVVAHMADVSEQLEEIEKTLDDFKMEADPQRIPRDIPNDVATFRDATRH
ncbi:hypothetical protein CJ030_MR0G006225 [Morella rubra]|uniref:Uncharacterized protein n=1 Tax=Morella rubra TaxID=262757 RepID=A0A6A1UKX6_9ROSI|nr:hypothetical protein CJ030_MR0G006225 [Morella rubra]